MFNVKSLLAILSITALNSSIYAMPPKPAKCPTISSIKSAGLSYVSRDKDSYVVAQFNTYDTNNNWLFGFASIKARTSYEALSIGNQLLDTLWGAPQPMAIPSENLWGCLYQTSQGSYGVALTPVNQNAKINQSLMSVLR